ncbi:hypothetical protein RJG79_02855 [Mycoplasmatota bacterium WC44]
MPFERGGRADKRGNKYEVIWCISQLLKVVEEKLDYVVFEPLGEDELGVDLIVCDKNGKLEGQQCKGRNGTSETWDYGSLNKKGIIEKWRDQLGRDSKITVSLVSPLSFTNLEDLVDRARNCGNNPSNFYKHQVSSYSKKFINFSRNICKEFGFDIEDESDAPKAVDYLSRIGYRQVPDSQQKEFVYEKIGMLFSGSQESIYSSFVTWLFEGGIYSKCINITEIRDFLQSKDITEKDLSTDSRIFPKIQELNNEYDSGFMPLSEGLINRTESESCIHHILNENSTILHGKAGSGKSGVTANIVNYCKENGIPYVAVKLDIRTPRRSVRYWSEELGLPSSVVHCLHSISRERKAVIILDQLDALRWTVSHSQSALSVCSNLIKQVDMINKERTHKINLVLVCRTHDFKHDKHIKALFNNIDSEKTEWKEVEVREFSSEVVSRIVGPIYDLLTVKLKRLLSNPNNLYIWQQLNKPEEHIECTSTYQLITKWWIQIQKDAIHQGVSEESLISAKNNMVEVFDRIGTLSAVSSQLSLTESATEYLVSCGFIRKQDRGSVTVVSFAHQSLFDAFLAEKMFTQYLNRETMTTIVGEIEKQTPSKRYQMQMFMQKLYDYSEDQFLKFGNSMLNTEEIRFSYKYIFLEMLNQINTPSNNVKKAILELVKRNDLYSHVVSSVVNGNKCYVRLLRSEGILDDWIAIGKMEEVISLFQSVKSSITSEDIDFIEKYVFVCEDLVYQWLRCFSFNILDDTDKMFKLRMKLYSKHPELMDTYIDLSSLIKGSEMKVIDMIILLCKSKSKLGSRLHIYEDLLDTSSELLIENGLEVLDKLLPLVPCDTSNDYSNSDWSWQSPYNKSIERAIINIIKKANVAVINQNPESFFMKYRDFMGKGFATHNELILDGMVHLPKSCSNRVLDYFCENIEGNMIINSSDIDRLSLSKEALKNHFGGCDSNVQEEFLSTLYSYCLSDILDLYRRRVDYNKMKYKGSPVYWSFWGDLQYELLSVIPDELLNKKSLNLKKVLTRKFKNSSTRFRRDLMSRSGSVYSPIDDKELSDDSWLGILTSKSMRKRNGIGLWNEQDGKFIDNSIEQFSRSFSSSVSNNPLRMISLVLKNHLEIHNEFVDALYLGLYLSNEVNSVPSVLIEELLIRYPIDSYSERARNFCGIISKHNEKWWSEDVQYTINNIALNHKNPVLGEPVVHDGKDMQMKTTKLLISNALNCARGSAAIAIGDLLWRNPSFFDVFKNTVDALMTDKNPAVRFASLYALHPILDIDSEWATQRIINLFNSDIRNVGYRYSRKMLLSFYDKSKSQVTNIIQRCFDSEDEKLIEVGAYSITEMYISNGEFRGIFADVSSLTKQQAKSILYMTVNYFELEEFVESSKDIVYKFVRLDYDLEWHLVRLLNSDYIDVDRDREFLHKVLGSKFSRNLVRYFSKFIEKSNSSIIFFSDMIFELSNTVIKHSDKNEIFGSENEVYKLIMGLYDEASSSNDTGSINVALKCLDIWDLMFEKQIGSARKLSFELMQR